MAYKCMFQVSQFPCQVAQFPCQVAQPCWLPTLTDVRFLYSASEKRYFYSVSDRDAGTSWNITFSNGTAVQLSMQTQCDPNVCTCVTMVTKWVANCFCFSFDSCSLMVQYLSPLEGQMGPLDLGSCLACSKTSTLTSTTR